MKKTVQTNTNRFSSYRLGTDTVKRGISSAGLNSTSSLSNGKIKESISNYSIKQEHSAKEGRDWYTLDRNRSGNTITSARSVLFASDATSSLSSYSLSDKAKSPSLSHSPSTSQLIKQTLSPLAQHRNISQSNLNSSSLSLSSSSAIGAAAAAASTKNQTNSFASYQFPSSNLNLKNHSSTLKENHSPLPIRKTSSPSRSLSNTSTLPSSVARNILYQSDSNYSVKNQQATTNFTSSGNNGMGISGGNGIGAVGNTIVSSPSPLNNIYGTLPKNLTTAYISGAISGNGIATSSLYGNTTTSAVTSGGNEFDKLIARYSGTGGTNNIGAGNYNTIGSYKVQYSSTNPFLPSFNPNSNENGINHDKN